MTTPKTFNGFLSMAASDCVNADHGQASHLCRRCGELVVSLDESGKCYDGCEATALDEGRLSEARRRLYLDAARAVRRAGHPEEAAWHEVQQREEEHRTLLMDAAQADTHSSDVEPMVERLESKS